jgi:hypothetical protein
MPTEWEYKLLTAQSPDGPLCDEAGNQYGKLSETTLNALGKLGWEVCAYDFLVNYWGKLIVKRKRSAQG